MGPISPVYGLSPDGAREAPLGAQTTAALTLVRPEKHGQTQCDHHQYGAGEAV